MRLLASLLLGALLVAAPAGADDYPRNWDIDVLHYAFHLQLSDAGDRIEGTARITTRFDADGIAEFALDLVGTSEAGTGMTVTGVESEGMALAHRHADDRLLMSLAAPSVAGARHTFTVRYAGTPADGLIIGTNRFGDRTFFGDNWPNRARHWLPTVDHVSDKATVEWLVTAPVHYQVIGTGRLLESTDLGDGTRLTHWGTEVPIPPKVMVMGAARFAVQHVDVAAGVPVQSWVYPQNRAAGFHDYALAAKALRFFDAHIGPFPYEKLANVQSKTRYGGMENASNIFYSENSVSGTRGSERLIAHEVAHQWFGDSVTEGDWHHIWLSEGFATYFAQLYVEFTYGRERMVAAMQAARDTVRAFYAASPELPLIAEQLRDPNRMLNRNAYQKGAWVLHMLRHRIGDDAFWSGIRSYYAKFRDGNALTEDLQSVMEETSGDHLADFFQQWAHLPGHPQLDGTWNYDGGQLHVTIRQNQPSGRFEFPLDIGIAGGAQSALDVRTVQVSQVEQSFSFEVAAAPATVTLDPHTWLLFEGELTRR